MKRCVRTVSHNATLSHYLAQVESVQLIADGKAPRVPQTEEGASYEGIQKKSNAKVRALISKQILYHVI